MGKSSSTTTALSTGAVSVISGALVEAVPWRDDTGRLTLVRHELQAGATLGFGAGHVHDVTNESDEHALSLHVYSPALTSMTFYELTEDRPGGAGRGVVRRRQRGIRTRQGRGARRRGGDGRPLTAHSADDLLASARARIRRVEPDELDALFAAGALVVDIRPAAQRAAEGELGFGLVVERNVLEWRFDLTGNHTLPEVSGLRPTRGRGVLGGLCLELGGGIAARARFHRSRRPEWRLCGLAPLA